MSKKVSDILPKTEILAQLAEEASELAQAALKPRRALDGTNPTPKSVAECEANLMEEFADINNAVDALCDALFGDDLDSEREFWDVRKAKGLPCDWKTGMDVFRWWMEDDNISGQLSMDDLMEDNNV